MPIANTPFRLLLGDDIRFPMSLNSDLNIEYLANLARLALTGAEQERFSRKLGDILQYVEKL